MAKRIGKHTIELENKIKVVSSASIVGKKEGEGPLSNYFDEIIDDATLKQNTWEQAESELQKRTLIKAMDNKKLKPDDIDIIFGGDLLNQCSATSFSIRNFDIAFAGLYGACSTMALSMALSSLFVDSGIAGKAAAITSSHFCSAEKQFRTPLEYGGQRPPTAQWTVTASGCAIFSGSKQSKIRATKVIFGRICDMGIEDAANMGAAMAPAACETICSFLIDTNTKPEDYDLILTGDLGKIGSDLLKKLCVSEYSIDISDVQDDCGLMIYNLDSQDVNSGGSGAGCSACVVCSNIFKRMEDGELNKVLFVGTGALLSSLSPLQGETIPAIAHGILFERDK